jgi:NAD(P)H dehydrogenase (quinone)
LNDVDVALHAVVIYHSVHGHTERLAQAIAEGAAEVEGTTVTVKRVEDASPEDLLPADVVFWGSPTHFGLLSAAMKQFIDETISLFRTGSLADKVGSVFTSSGAIHGDQEFALWSLVVPMIQHGMIIVGLEPQDPANNRFGYHFGVGASSLHHGADERPSRDELAVARAMGRRATLLAGQLKRGQVTHAT